MNLIIYRGPLERARLAFIFEAIFEKYNDIYFIWIFPGKLEGERKTRSIKFLEHYDFIGYEILEHSYKDYFATRKSIKSIVKDKKINLISIVGFSTLEFVFGLSSSKKIWFINGVPEEKSLSEDFWLKNKVVDFMWSIKKFFIKDIDLVITVSERMKRLVHNRLNIENIFAAPTCVDTKIFKGGDKKMIDFCYMGSGAVWQGLDLLSKVWAEIYKLNPNYTFRVISRDVRTKILGEGIPNSNIEFVSSSNFEEVAILLSECKAGFLLRKDHIVNKVSFPTKLAEYLASDCWVISTDIDWDIKDYFEKYKIGLLVSPNDLPSQIASEVNKFQNLKDFDLAQIKACTNELDRKLWIRLLGEKIDYVQ